MYDFNGTIMNKGLIVKGYIEKLYASWGIDQSQLWSTYYTIPAGAGTAASPYLVYTPNELAYFAFLTRTSVCSDVIQLEADIDLDVIIGSRLVTMFNLLVNLMETGLLLKIFKWMFYQMLVYLERY